MLNTGKGCPYFGTGVCNAFIHASLKSSHFSRTSSLQKKNFRANSISKVARPPPFSRLPAPRLPMLAEEAPAIATSKKM